MNRQPSDSTPPQIVERAADPESALAAFIAQELENWGFKAGDSYPADQGGVTLEVESPNRRYTITVQ